MKKYVAVTVLILFLLAGNCITLAKAYTYDSGQTTPSEVGQLWGFLATTDDPAVTKVRFEWFYGGALGTPIPAWTVVDDSAPFEGSIVPDKPGDWYVLISFLDKNDNILHSDSHLENFKLDQVIPEVPLLGAGGAIVAMLLGLVYFKRRKIHR
jgi:hypothetical protein